MSTPHLAPADKRQVSWPRRVTLPPHILLRCALLLTWRLPFRFLSYPPDDMLSLPVHRICASPRRLLTGTLVLCGLLAGVSMPARAEDNCFIAAAKYQHVNPLILRAIAYVESRDNPAAINKNKNGTTDFGLMQINSIHLKTLAQYNIKQDKLENACSSVFIAAWYLRQKMNKFGNTWDAVGAYHSETPEFRDIYSKKIIATITRWQSPSLAGESQLQQKPQRKGVQSVRRATKIAKETKVAPAKTRTPQKTLEASR